MELNPSADPESPCLTVTAEFPASGNVWNRISVIIDFDQSVSYAIHSQSGKQLGYVPQKLVPLFAKQKIATVRIDKFSPYAVPWKRYRVMLTVEGDVS